MVDLCTVPSPRGKGATTEHCQANDHNYSYKEDFLKYVSTCGQRRLYNPQLNLIKIQKFLA